MTLPWLTRDGEINIIENDMSGQTAADRFNVDWRVDRFSQFALHQRAQVDLHNPVLKQKIGAHQAQKPEGAPEKSEAFTGRHLLHRAGLMKWIKPKPELPAKLHPLQKQAYPRLISEEPPVRL